MTSPGSRPGSPAYPQPTPVPGSSATRTSSADPPSGAGPAVSTTIARAPGSPPHASPVTDQPVGIGSGTQAGTRASAVTAEIASWAISTVWCSGVTAPCTWHQACAVEPGRTTSCSPHLGQTAETLIAHHRPVSERLRQAEDTGPLRKVLRSLPRMGRADCGTGMGRPVVACVGAVVHDAAGRLLLIRRGQEPSRGLWSLPGGRVEPGETRAEAVVREVREETGLEVRAGEPVGRVLIPAGDVDYDVTDLRCALVAPGTVPVAGDDAEAVTFADAPTLDRLACTPDLREVLRGWGVLPA